MSLNNVLIPFNMYSNFTEGWLMKIPMSCKPKTGVFFCYKVLPGDSFNKLAATFGVPAD